MQSNQSHIQTITKLLNQIHQSPNIIEFDSIEIPFELVKVTLNFCKSTFTLEVLQQLANSDTDTLDAWAIALSSTLNTQLEIINSWLPHLTTLPIPSTLKQKIAERTQAIAAITNEKSQLLNSASELLNQEKHLDRQATVLSSLKQKTKQLRKIQEELQSTNLETLQQEVISQERELEPQRQLLMSLQQQKSDLDYQISGLQSQQATLKEEISYWQSRLNRLEISTVDTISQALTLTQLQRERLSETLSTELGALEQQRRSLVQQVESYHQAQQQLHQAKEDFQKYQAATAEILTVINNHYHSNQELKSLLPVDIQKVDSLIKNIQSALTEIDNELATARSIHEQAQQKNRIPL